jgi:hypothetical protein
MTAVVQWTLVATTVGLLVAGMTWLGGSDTRGHAPGGAYEPHKLETWLYTGGDAAERRHNAIRRAVFEVGNGGATTEQPTAHELVESIAGPEMPACRFLASPPSGTSAKFDCVFDGGEIVKVKYGRNPEIHAETAATELLRMLGYPADTVAIVPRLRCYGCPRFPFITMHLRQALGLSLESEDADEGYTDFEWVSVERKYPAHEIETEAAKGWSWWELDGAGAPRADVDALRLTAVFLAHWDNKDVNQRLVCLDGPPPGPDAECQRPLALIQDLGATFGPSKVNLARWRALPIWSDRQRCTVSMAALPFRGASFADVQISEEGRAKLASRLAAISDADVARLFSNARFPQFQVGTDDEGDLEAWVAAFRHRADQIVSARCPAAEAVS